MVKLPTASPGHVEELCYSPVSFSLQVIETVSAADPDAPLGGHRFFFNLAQEAAGKANFSVRDNKGNTLYILERPLGMCTCC